jgi:hypothetical protein
MTWARSMPVAPKIPTPADDLRRPARQAKEARLDLAAWTSTRCPT